jgi:DNA mismatch endonuclease (patch repair protein)
LADIVDKKTRTLIMASIKNKNTIPELNIRKALFAKGIRYRLHDRKLPGSPDLVFPKYKAVIFIHGCFWHNHNCKHGRLPSSNRQFWEVKLQGNAMRDQQTMVKLHSLGWRTRIIWLCSLKNKQTFESDKDVDEIVNWLKERQPKKPKNDQAQA